MKCPKCRCENPEGTRFCGNCAAPLPSPEEIPFSATKTLETPILELIRGTTFANRYEIIEELGKGGMARVYRAYDQKIEEDIALKLIKPEISADENMIERFRNELKLARKITHKNVCRMFDLNEEDGTHYITMEYVPGENLKTLIKRMGKIPAEKSISIAKQVCMGLMEAHRIGIIHRDLKPQNIMIDKQGNARVMDFGIARSVQGAGITANGMAIGTPDYMSPEQVKGQKTDQRSDIYSLGVTLYEMLTGKVPFEDKTLYAVAMKHLTDIPKAPKELDPLIPEDLNDIILKCLEKEKEKRFQNVKEFLAELEKIERKTKETMKELSAEGTVESKRIPPLAIIGILLLGVVIIGGSYLLLEKSPQPEKTEAVLQASEWKNSIAVLPFRDLSPEQDQEHFCFGMTDAINDQLTKLGVLKVTATTSVMRYKNTEKDIKDIGQELGVTNILEGSVLVEADRIRVRGQLIDAESGFHIWSDAYDRKLESIMDVQDEVSQAIARALQIKLTPDTITAMKEDKPSSLEAYEYYVKGMNFLEGRYLITNQEEDFEAAVRMFEKSKEIDPNYVQAYQGLAWAYTHRLLWSGDPDDRNRVIRNNEIAYKLNPDSASANAAKATSCHLSGEFEEVFKFYKRAVELNPNISRIIFSIGVLCRNCGLHHKAIKYFERAIELNPFYIYSFGGLGGSYYYLGEFEKAAFYFDKVLEMNPNEPIISSIYPSLSVMMKQYDKAEEMINKWEKINPNVSGISNSKALVFAAKGERDKALALDADAAVYAMIGMKNEAIEAINKNEVKVIAYNYLSLINLSVFDNLRDDPRFQDILEKKKKIYKEILKWAAGL